MAVENPSKDIIIDTTARATPIVDSIDNVLINADKNDSVSIDPSQQIVEADSAVELSAGIPLEKDQQKQSGTKQIEQQNVSITPTVMSSDSKNESIESTIEIPPIELNLTVEEHPIPVFSEWAQKRLEEVEKEGEQEVVNVSSMKNKTPTANKVPVPKLKSAKNYASPDCGAKIIAANSESAGTSYVLTSTKDEYLLSPCKSRIWFIVELCEAIQAEHIDLANFELFSSSPKNFSVSLSNRFPTRDWSNVGRFVAKDERYIQSFDLYPHLFGKYVRVDIHSHYNSEHFCPISLFRVYGTSEFEAFETENRQHPIDDIDDDDEDDAEMDVAKGKSNIFKSASDAVMSIVDKVKKAASFVKPNENNATETGSENAAKSETQHNNCVTPNFAINCENCTETETSEVTALSECKQQLLSKLLSIDVVRNSLYKSQICTTLIGQDLNINCSEPINSNATTSKQLTDLQMEYITHLFSLKYITAMCNLLAANDRRVPWNSTYPFNTEPPLNVTVDKKTNKILANDKPKNGIIDSAAVTSEYGQDAKKDSSEVSVEDNAESDRLIQLESSGNEKINEIPMGSEEPALSSKETDIKTTTPSMTIQSSADVEQADQNIFNIVEPVEIESESNEQKDIDDVVTPKTDTIANNNNNYEQATLPNVIIVPETTTPTPSNDISDTIDEQTNGWTNTPQFGQKFHSESVFLRLSNRVKVIFLFEFSIFEHALIFCFVLFLQALERNMSLSGQYLEELSRRYKKQVEELQVSFAKTLVNIEEQSRRNLERKQELFEQNQKLRNDLEILTQRIFSWSNILICCACFTCVQILIFHIILRIWGRKYGLLQRSGNLIVDSPSADNRKRKSANVPIKFRRKSAEEKRERNPSESSIAALQRRPSTEALNISGTYAELLIEDSDSILNVGEDYQLYDRDSQKKARNTKNASNDHQDHDSSEFIRIEDLKQMYDKPNADYEFYGPAPDLKLNELKLCANDSHSSQTTLSSSVGSTSPQPKKIKSIKNQQKNRRLSSPSFFKTRFSNATSTPQTTTGWEWHRSKKALKSSQINSKKSKSESPVAVKRANGINNNSPVKQNCTDSTRSSISSSYDGDRKQSSSFKRILKKIF